MPARVWLGEADAGRVWEQSWVLKGTSTERMCPRDWVALWVGALHPPESDSLLLFIDRGTSAHPSIPWRHDALGTPRSDDWRVCYYFRHCVGSLHIFWGMHSLFTPGWARVWVLQTLIPESGFPDWCIIPDFCLCDGCPLCPCLVKTGISRNGGVQVQE